MNRNLTETAGVLVRWLLGGLFIYMGLSKALQPVDFLKLLRQYNLLQSPWQLDTVAVVLPWFEVFCGMLLVAGVAVRGSALVMILMLVPFTAAVYHRAWVLHSIQAIPFCTVKFDCGCGAGEVFVCRKLLENFILILLACWLLTGQGKRLCLRHRLQ